MPRAEPAHPVIHSEATRDAMAAVVGPPLTAIRTRGTSRGISASCSICQRLVCFSDECQDGARVAPLGQPVMPAMSEVAIVGDLQVANRGLGEFGFEVEGANAGRGAMKYEGSWALPEQFCRGLPA